MIKILEFSLFFRLNASKRPMSMSLQLLEAEKHLPCTHPACSDASQDLSGSLEASRSKI